MSKAYYKSGISPTLLRTFTNNTKSRSVQVWLTPCIVTKFGKSTSSPACNVLINPGNPQLSGVSKFPYFPKGGPVPKDYVKGSAKDWQPLGYVSNWGGMDVGSGMLYASSVVDGLVHQLGGWQLRLQCSMKPVIEGDDERCPVGTCVTTYARGGQLLEEYDIIVHTTPPFYRYHNQDNPIPDLQQCYRNSLSTAASVCGDNGVIALPLLGAGGRGFPLDLAIDVASSESIEWCGVTIDEDTDNNEKNHYDGNRHNIVAFGIPELSNAEALIRAIEEKAKSCLKCLTNSKGLQ